MVSTVQLPFDAAPVIDTKRLRLRSHAVLDFDACVAMWSDPTTTQYTIGAACPPQRTWQRLLAYRGHWALLGFGYWAVEEKASSRYIGELGFADFKRDIQPCLDGAPELGWALVAAARGNGYATEALNAAVAWGDTHFGDRTTTCIIHSANLPSLRVAAKLGYQESTRISVDGIAEVIFRRAAHGAGQVRRPSESLITVIKPEADPSRAGE